MCSPTVNGDADKNPFLVVAVAILRMGVRKLEMGTIFAELPWCLEEPLIFEVIVIALDEEEPPDDNWCLVVECATVQDDAEAADVLLAVDDGH